MPTSATAVLLSYLLASLVLLACAPTPRFNAVRPPRPPLVTPVPAIADAGPACPASVVDKATGAYFGAFTPEERGVFFVFRGTLREVQTGILDNPKVKEPCSIAFEVTDVPWDGPEWFASEVGLPPSQRVKQILVLAEHRFPAEFPALLPGTEWLVVVENYGGFSERRYAFAPSCGRGGWLAQIRDEQVYFDPTGRGDPERLTHLPWLEVRARILAPIDAVSADERHRAALRELAAIEASAPQREEDARLAEEIADELSGKNLTIEALVRDLDSDDPEQLMNGLHFLRARSSAAGVERAIALLQHRDAYVWLNAAMYLGRLKRPECVPYLIKAFRHTNWGAEEERLQMLEDLTGERFGLDFHAWRAWWARRHPEPFDWDSKLGPKPRL